MESFLRALKKLFPYNLSFIGVFFALPMIVASMENEEAVSSLLLVLLLQVNPWILFFISLVFGIRHGFHCSCPIAVVLWFLFSMLFFYFNFQFLIFLLLYTVCSAGGCYLGGVFKQRRDEMYL